MKRKKTNFINQMKIMLNGVLAKLTAYSTKQSVICISTLDQYVRVGVGTCCFSNGCIIQGHPPPLISLFTSYIMSINVGNIPEEYLFYNRETDSYTKVVNDHSIELSKGGRYNLVMFLKKFSCDTLNTYKTNLKCI